MSSDGEQRVPASRRALHEQQEEMDNVDPLAPIGVVSRGQARGAIGLGVVLALVGGVLAAALSLVFTVPGFDRWVLALLFGIGGVMAGGVIGFVFGGGRGPERAREVDDLALPENDTDR